MHFKDIDFFKIGFKTLKDKNILVYNDLTLKKKDKNMKLGKMVNRHDFKKINKKSHSLEIAIQLNINTSK